MVLTIIQTEILFQYRDKSYICSMLCQQSSDWYNFLKTITNIPLITISSVMSILNSIDISNNNNYNIRIPNIIINASFALILSLINNFKILEKQSNFKSLNIKYIKLTHQIEDIIINNLENCTKEDIKRIINDYDSLSESLDFPFPGFIKRRIKNRFYGKKTLPNILNCEIGFMQHIQNTPKIKYLDKNKNNNNIVSIKIDKNTKNIDLINKDNSDYLDKDDLSPISNITNNNNNNNNNKFIDDLQVN